MNRASTVSMCRGFNVGLFILIITTCLGFARDYKNAYEADEALLEKLSQMRMNNWVGFQLDVMRSRYANRKDDMEYVEAMYAKTKKLRIEKLSKIAEGSSRYAEAQYRLALNKTENKEKVVHFENAYKKLKGNKDKAELFGTLVRYLLSVYVELGRIEDAIKLIKEGGNTDKRYLEYQSARLQLMIGDKELEESGKLSAKTKGRMEKVVKELTTKGELFWQADVMAMLGYCELAHAYVLMDNPAAAIKTISSSYAQIKGFDEQFEGEEKKFSPMVAAFYYLARAYALQADHVKTGKAKPPKTRVKQGDKVVSKTLSKEEGVKVLLKKAFNIMQETLQERKYRQSRYSKQALRDLEGIRKSMVEAGLKPPKQKASQAKLLAQQKAFEFYREKKYKEAVEQFEIALKGENSGEDYRDNLFFMSAAYCYLNEFDKAKEYAFRCVKYFQKDIRAWEAIHNVGIKAKKAANELREEKPEEAAKLRQLASEMYMKIANENKGYPKIASVLWQEALSKWSEAGKLSDKKKNLTERIDKIADPNSPQRKKLNDELKEVVAQIKKEYVEAIPFFQRIIDNYSNSPFGIKSIYRIGWIHYINDDRDKAIEYFLRFCDESSQVSADYLDAKYVAADLLFRKGQMDRAEALFKDIIKQTEKDQIDTSNASVAKRVNRFRTGAKALLPWIYDRKGEELLDKAQSMLDQNEELEGLVGEYEAAINENKKEPKPVVKVPLPTPPAIPTDAPKTFSAGKLPENFAFRDFLLKKTAIRVDLVAPNVLPDDITIAFKDGLLWFSKNHDTIGCTGGKGFEVEISGKRVDWKSEKVACYRDGKLVCIYDPTSLTSRVANDGEATMEIDLPVATQEVPANELELRLKFLQKQVDANVRRYQSTRKEGLALQQVGLKGMQEFLEEFPKDKVFSPTILLRIATIYVSLEKWVNAEEYISTLQRKFPKSSEADKSPIYLFRILRNAIDKELDPDKQKILTDRAQNQADEIIKTIQTQSKGNVNLLAFKLFEKNGKGEMENMSPELTSAALDEVLRRGADESHPDHPRFSRLREKALLYKAMVMYTLKAYGDAVQQIEKLLKEKPKTAYFFKAMTLKAKAYRSLKKYNEAMKTIGEVVTKASVVRDRRKHEYWLGILEFGRIYAARENKASYKAAKTPLEQCIEGIKKDEKKLQDIREGAFFELFRVYKKLGDNEKAITLQNEYLRTYPDGAYRSDFSKVD